MPKHFTSFISSYFGKFAAKEFSPKLQRFINSSYVKLMSLDMSAFESPGAYQSLNKLFTRAFVNPPKLPKEKDLLISGVEALISDAGKIEEGKAYQIKGVCYDIEKLFGEYHRDLVKRVEGGEFINFYLSPKDYHRYHMPMRLKIVSLTHIPGKLYPVNFPFLRYKKDLFIENERVVIACEDEKGRSHVLVLVGALNVGKMVITFEDAVHTNSHIRMPKHYRYENLILQRGELFGWFEMGSTLLIFSQKGSIDPHVRIGKKVAYADILGKIL